MAKEKSPRKPAASRASSAKPTAKAPSQPKAAADVQKNVTPIEPEKDFKSATAPIFPESASPAVSDENFVPPSENSLQLAMQIAHNNEPTVVIPYKKSSAKGLELLYAIRAWEQKLEGVRIFVIGDREDWFSDLVDHIPHEVSSDNPQIDIAAKLLIAIADDSIPENFILSNDDIFPVTTLHEADLELLTCSGILEPKRRVSPTYQENLKRTLEALEKAGVPHWDYSTHTPFSFSKTLLAQIFETYRPDKDGYLISSLYYNTLFPEVIPLRIRGDANSNGYVAYVYRENPDLQLLKEAFNTRKFINVNSKGYAPVLPFLQKAFPLKSKFEK